MQVGVKALTDNYQARLESFASSLQTITPTQSKELMGQVLQKDPGALNSWLSPTLIREAVAKGSITAPQRAMLAEGFAANYNQGHPALSAKKIDGLVLDQNSSNVTLRQRQMNDFVGFVNSSQGAEATQFKKNYGQHLIDQYAFQGANRYTPVLIAANLIGGDSQHPEMAVDVLSRYNPEQLGQITHLAQASQNYSPDSLLKTEAFSHSYQKSDIAVDDGLKCILSSVSKTDGPKAKELAVTLARTAAENPSWFEPGLFVNGEPVSRIGRVNALGSLVAAHSEPIFDSMTVYDRNGASIISKPDWVQYNVNARDLGNLFHRTLFNQNSMQSNLLSTKIIDYANSLKSRINNAKGDNKIGFYDAASRLGMLSASTTYAVSQGYTALRDDQTQKTALIGLAIDLALKPIPFGDNFSAEAKGIMASSFLSDSKILSAVKNINEEKLIDKRTGYLTVEARDKLIKSLGEDKTTLVEKTNVQNLLKEALVFGINDEQQYKSVIDTADRVAKELSD